MAQKRMFSKDIVDSDYFYDLPFSSQLLYFHLGMHADVKGFIQPKKIIRTVGLKLEDLKPLIEKNFVIPFETGVVVITHWNLNNNVREDREADTIFRVEQSRIVNTDGIYELLQEDSRRTPAQIRLGKIRLDKNKILEIYNHCFKKSGKSTNGFEANIPFWADDYSMEDVALAFLNAAYDPFWRSKMTPTIMFRKKNPQKEPVDYIGQFIAQGKKTNDPFWLEDYETLNNLLQQA